MMHSTLAIIFSLSLTITLPAWTGNTTSEALLETAYQVKIHAIQSLPMKSYT
jgi:hypothetical protein